MIFKQCFESFVEIIVDNPRLVFTFDQQPKDSNGDPRKVYGVVMLDKYLCVVYLMYDTVQVFSCEESFKKIKDIQVNEMCYPWDIVGCSVTSQLFLSDFTNGNIVRVLQ
jgi:hypothetical protein